MDENWERAQELFHAALACEAGKREAFLAAACGDDEGLRADVESLLESDERADALFPVEEDRESAVEPERSDPLIGERIGEFTIKEVIASGGMSTVYLAQQDHPDRPVALKIMSPMFTSRNALRRFELESEMLARLRHPNIAHVYGAGVRQASPTDPRAVPYFAMEYISGARTLTEYARAHGLSTRERLELFAEVCDAVHFGHQQGIIHRDLKPANILVDVGGRPKVIDFGVARATDSDVAVTTMRTDVGQIVGTLQYMSPEQCEADPRGVDTRSDVYSLGVILYELLTGERPYDANGTSIYVAVRTIREHEPIKPSAVNRSLGGDVEAILLKALEKDRDKRYGSAGDLAGDICRYLRGDPVEACSPTVWARAVRWTIRHPVMVTACVCLIVGVSIIGTAMASVAFLYGQPHRLVTSEDRRTLTLYSRAGGVFHEWSTKRGTISGVLLRGAPRTVGVESLALVGFGGVLNYPFPNSICAFNAFRIDEEHPLWERHIETEDLPQTLVDRGLRAGEFGATLPLLGDIFRQARGQEVTVSHTHCPFSETAIRVYDLHGNVLYQVWYDGTLESVYWMEDAGLLV